MKKLILSSICGIAMITGISAQAFIPNSGFETWGASIGEPQQPSGWISFNLFASPLFNAANPTFVTAAGNPDNYQGTYSCKITTKTFVQNPDSVNIPWTSGTVMTGSFALTSPYFHPGYATQQRPASFTYYAKYAPAGVDTAWCLVSLTHWNTSTGMRDSIGWGFDYLPTAVGSYTMRTINMTYLSPNAPDTCTIWFSSSSNYSPQVNSALFVDALSFSGFVGMEDLTRSNGVDVYPNPSNGVTNFDVISSDASQVLIYDMTGREVKRLDITDKHAEFNSYLLPAGVYSYSILNGAGELQNRGKFSVTE